MFNSLPPIARLAQRILADIENAVRRFPRYHKYTVGSDLRAQAMAVARCTHRAWRDADRKRERDPDEARERAIDVHDREANFADNERMADEGAQ